MLSLFAVLSVLSASPETDVEAVIDRMHQAASRADGAEYFSQFTPDARFIGTDATERWSLTAFRAYAEPYFARGQGWAYVPRERTVTIAPIDCRCIAWFDETLNNASYGHVRGSGVLRLTVDGWKIEQYVLSFAVPNDRADAVVAAIKATE
ncbi:MAG: protein with SnoaL 3 domain, NTF 2 superfamily [Alphaproteobacteria bacterium]|nr:MAG: protein with SnoaL 3 domain, NTF 2 superfamily [Alphaproteobacteria bacterium]